MLQFILLNYIVVDSIDGTRHIKDYKKSKITFVTIVDIWNAHSYKQALLISLFKFLKLELFCSRLLVIWQWMNLT